MANYYTQDAFARIDATLASAVADAGTVTLSYPTGYTQANFLLGQDAAAYVIVGNNDKYTAADSDMSLTFNSGDITLTNSSGVTWAAGSDIMVYANIEDGNDVVLLTIPVELAAVTGAGDVVTDLQPGIAGTIESVQFLVTNAVTTAAKLATFNLEIGTTDVTGGVLALTSAAATPLGKVLTATDITANNTLTAASKISLEASSVTAFAEGKGVFYIRIRRS